MPMCGLPLRLKATSITPRRVSWFDAQAEGTCAFCRVTQLALLRHLTNPKIMGADSVQTQVEAWRKYEALAADPRVVYLEEPPRLTSVFKSLTQVPRPAHKRWTMDEIQRNPDYWRKRLVESVKVKNAS